MVKAVMLQMRLKYIRFFSYPRRYNSKGYYEKSWEKNYMKGSLVVVKNIGVSIRYFVNTFALYPYHYTPKHVFEKVDHVSRLYFCRFMLNEDLEDSSFLKNILWTDELKFDKDDINNYWPFKE